MTRAPSRHHVVHCVAFASSPEGGNPCPVVLDADGLSGEQMQALAAELGHETAFVLTPTDDGDARLRFFVPRHEMEMCVHASAASAVVLARAGRAPRTIETPLGLRRVEVDRSATSAMVEQSVPTFGPVVADPSAVLEALGADADAVVGPVRAASTARAKLLVPLRDEAALDRLRPDPPRLWRLCDELGVTGFYPYTRAARDADAAARQFPRDAGYDEDPATGLAACALGAHLSSGAPTGGRSTWTIAQGRAMGRPSRMTVETRDDGERVLATRVGGPVTVLPD
ncbi:PhzF family phenazine biosynthesis protein [Patulibacter americanus]|uniref:PhzF family phenazine biosynthesis protein n=1 Tax=Patulibacter americanus TaxID=588672 RepID=UPI000406B6ED|nr:PhzF family phenazine biosynthesis isomerase [Patulibacter americanus]